MLASFLSGLGAGLGFVIAILLATFLIPTPF